MAPNPLQPDPLKLDPPLPVPGFKVGTASCGVKSVALKGRRQDLTLIVADQPCAAAGSFTQNRWRAACVAAGEATIATHGDAVRAIVANAGNANAGVGEMERVWSQQLISSAASSADVAEEAVLSASTGVIGTPFPIERITASMDDAAATLRPDGWESAANAIRTTDTFAKWGSATVDG
ncbi:MAG: bifunctional ornithine acetyltransferase/N-acetylglutamate synthase, partial [Mariprofundales bacterium]|nr:bifunctional ornithine acetyltransferase/N-acetylglutamate synthase [Mariprofundales bacterium]